MHKSFLSFLVFAITFVVHVPDAAAADDGQTRPKLNLAGIHSGITAVDVIALTNGAGNVKGVNCASTSSTALSNATVEFYVDGGSAQIIALSGTFILQDTAQTYYTGYIPMNVRFGSSIRVRMTGTAWTNVSCSASWGLD